MLLEANIATDIIHEALNCGADFCDIFVEQKKNQEIKIRNEQVEAVNKGIDFGIGIRLIYGTDVVYGYTNNTDREELLRVTQILGAKNKSAPNKSFQSFDMMAINNIHPVEISFDSPGLTDQKISYLHQVHQAAKSESPLISLVEASALQSRQQVQIFNSEGLATTDERNYCRLYVQTIAEKDGEQSQGFHAPGALTGWELSKQIDPKELGIFTAKQSLVKLSAADCPGGKMPVIIGNGFGGVIFHEACGHLLETTSVQKKASVFWDKLDTQIAHSCVNAVDDGTLSNVWGSINIDDEGMPTQKTQLIKDGKLVNFMSDRVGELKTGHKATGSGRRQSYRFAPASRMRNTYIEPGKNSMEEMLSTVEKGIFCKNMGGGSVNPGTGEFNFAANESYLIENGKITTPLKSATLIGTGPDILQKISMVGNDLDMTAGMCGSVSGSVPVTVGQPSLKVDEILVGGQK